MADKNIVLEENEDLGKLRGGSDAVRCVDNGVGFGFFNLITKLETLFQFIEGSPMGGHILGAELGAKFTHDSVANTIAFLSSSNGAAWDYSTQHIVPVVSGVNFVSMTYSGNTLTININGNIKTVAGRPNAPMAQTMTTIGARNLSTSYLHGVYNEIHVNDSYYIKDGDFGSPTLIDHSGNGNDGTLSSPNMWWKTLANGEPIDAIYENATVFYATLPATPVDFNKVIDINTDAPPTNDPSWGLYTDQWLVVTVQINAANFLLLLKKSGGRMPVIKRTTGTEILAISATGIQELNPVPTQISASTEVSMDVILVQDLKEQKLTPLTTVALNTFYEYGKIGAIDMDSIVGDLNTVIFGITT